LIIQLGTAAQGEALPGHLIIYEWLLQQTTYTKNRSVGESRGTLKKTEKGASPLLQAEAISRKQGRQRLREHVQVLKVNSRGVIYDIMDGFLKKKGKVPNNPAVRTFYELSRTGTYDGPARKRLGEHRKTSGRGESQITSTESAGIRHSKWDQLGGGRS